MKSTIEWIRCGAEAVVALLLGAMFVAFIIQIVFRYVFNFPIGWSSELSVVTWLYMVLIGSAFWLREHETIRFDLVSNALGSFGRRIVGALVSGAAVVLYAMSFPAAWQYVTFMKVESTDFMKIRLDILYSVFLLFAAATIIRYAWRFLAYISGRRVDEDNDPTKVSSGL